jgi:hypothetical protein
VGCLLQGRVHCGLPSAQGRLLLVVVVAVLLQRVQLRSDTQGCCQGGQVTCLGHGWLGWLLLLLQRITCSLILTASCRKQLLLSQPDRILYPFVHRTKCAGSSCTVAHRSSRTHSARVSPVGCSCCCSSSSEVGVRCCIGGAASTLEGGAAKTLMQCSSQLQGLRDV